MTTEDDFQRALDANSADHQTRLVFADWLQDRDDPRAEGYRALGLNQFHTYNVTDPASGLCTWFTEKISVSDGLRELPDDWFHLLADGLRATSWVDYDSRREADDAAALAFAKLPKKRRAELLGARK
jgi:uncharacterized protein (TIGR02996 family)